MEINRTDIRPQLKAARDECETQLAHMSTEGIQLEVGSSTDAQLESINARLSEIATSLKDLHRMANRIDRQPERYQSWLDGYAEWTDLSHIDASADYAPVAEHVAKLRQQIGAKVAMLIEEKAQLEEYASFLRSKQALQTPAPHLQMPTNVDLALSGLSASMEWDIEPGLKATGRRRSRAADTTVKVDIAPHTDFSLASTMLPQLQLPTYDGDPSRWPTFIDSFNAAVDDAPIPPIQKLTILMGCLKDAAMDAVEGFSITNSNYAVVKDVLSERFGDSDYILQTLITQLIQLPSASSDLNSLRRLQNQVERVCRLLKSQGQDLNHDQTRVVIEAKLPKQLLRKIYEQKLENPKAYNTALLRKILRTELKIMEASERMSGALDIPTPLRPDIIPKAVACNTASSGRLSQKAPPKCRFCDDEHFSSNCMTYPTMDSRREACQTKRLCQACLGDSHQAWQCTAKKRCHYCKQTHVSALCPFRFSANNAQKHLTLTTTTHSDVLLLSQLTVIRNADGTRSREARVLYDSGSTVSVINNELARALRLTARTKRHMELTTISPYSPTIMPHVEYDVGVQTVNGTVIPLTLVGIDKLPTVRTAQVRSFDNDSLEAYLSVSRFEPQILIGQADEAKFRLSRIGQTSEGGQLFRTALGYGFSGPLTLTVALNNLITRILVRIEPTIADPFQPLRVSSVSTQTEALLRKSTGSSELNRSTPLKKKRLDPSKRIRCQFCLLEHWASDCATCPDLLSRLQACSLKNLCLNCLSNKHQTSECTLVKQCRYCQGQHVSALCSVQFSDCPQPAPPIPAPSFAPGGDGSEISPTVSSHGAHHGQSAHASQQATDDVKRSDTAFSRSTYKPLPQNCRAPKRVCYNGKSAQYTNGPSKVHAINLLPPRCYGHHALRRTTSRPNTQRANNATNELHRTSSASALRASPDLTTSHSERNELNTLDTFTQYVPNDGLRDTFSHSPQPVLESTNPSQPIYASGTSNNATGLTLPLTTQHTATFGDTPSAVYDADINESASDVYSSTRTSDDDHLRMEETQTSTSATETQRWYH